MKSSGYIVGGFPFDQELKDFLFPVGEPETEGVTLVVYGVT